MSFFDLFRPLAEEVEFGTFRGRRVAIDGDEWIRFIARPFALELVEQERLGEDHRDNSEIALGGGIPKDLSRSRKNLFVIIANRFINTLLYAREMMGIQLIPVFRKPRKPPTPFEGSTIDARDRIARDVIQDLGRVSLHKPKVGILRDHFSGYDRAEKNFAGWNERYTSAGVYDGNGKCISGNDMKSLSQDAESAVLAGIANSEDTGVLNGFISHVRSDGDTTSSYRKRLTMTPDLRWKRVFAEWNNKTRVDEMARAHGIRTLKILPEGVIDKVLEKSHGKGVTDHSWCSEISEEMYKRYCPLTQDCSELRRVLAECLLEINKEIVRLVHAEGCDSSRNSGHDNKHAISDRLISYDTANGLIHFQYSPWTDSIAGQLAYLYRSKLVHCVITNDSETCAELIVNGVYDIITDFDTTPLLKATRDMEGIIWRRMNGGSGTTGNGGSRMNTHSSQNSSKPNLGMEIASAATASSPNTLVTPNTLSPNTLITPNTQSSHSAKSADVINSTIFFCSRVGPIAAVPPQVTCKYLNLTPSRQGLMRDESSKGYDSHGHDTQGHIDEHVQTKTQIEEPFWVQKIEEKSPLLSVLIEPFCYLVQMHPNLRDIFKGPLFSFDYFLPWLRSIYILSSRWIVDVMNLDTTRREGTCASSSGSAPIIRSHQLVPLETAVDVVTRLRARKRGMRIETRDLFQAIRDSNGVGQRDFLPKENFGNAGKIFDGRAIGRGHTNLGQLAPISILSPVSKFNSLFTKEGDSAHMKTSEKHLDRVFLKLNYLSSVNCFNRNSSPHSTRHEPFQSNHMDHGSPRSNRYGSPRSNSNGPPRSNQGSSQNDFLSPDHHCTNPRSPRTQPRFRRYLGSEHSLSTRATDKFREEIGWDQNKYDDLDAHNDLDQWETEMPTQKNFPMNFEASHNAQDTALEPRTSVKPAAQNPSTVDPFAQDASTSDPAAKASSAVELAAQVLSASGGSKKDTQDKKKGKSKGETSREPKGNAVTQASSATRHAQDSSGNPLAQDSSASPTAKGTKSKGWWSKWTAKGNPAKTERPAENPKHKKKKDKKGKKVKSERKGQGQAEPKSEVQSEGETPAEAETKVEAMTRVDVTQESSATIVVQDPSATAPAAQDSSTSPTASKVIENEKTKSFESKTSEPEGKTMESPATPQESAAKLEFTVPSKPEVASQVQSVRDKKQDSKKQELEHAQIQEIFQIKEERKAQVRQESKGVGKTESKSQARTTSKQEAKQESAKHEAKHKSKAGMRAESPMQSKVEKGEREVMAFKSPHSSQQREGSHSSHPSMNSPSSSSSRSTSISRGKSENDTYEKIPFLRPTSPVLSRVNDIVVAANRAHYAALDGYQYDHSDDGYRDETPRKREVTRPDRSSYNVRGRSNPDCSPQRSRKKELYTLQSIMPKHGEENEIRLSANEQFERACDRNREMHTLENARKEGAGWKSIGGGQYDIVHVQKPQYFGRSTIDRGLCDEVYFTRGKFGTGSDMFYRPVKTDTESAGAKSVMRGGTPDITRGNSAMRGDVAGDVTTTTKGILKFAKHYNPAHEQTLSKIQKGDKTLHALDKVLKAKRIGKIEGQVGKNLGAVGENLKKSMEDLIKYIKKEAIHVRIVDSMESKILLDTLEKSKPPIPFGVLKVRSSRLPRFGKATTLLEKEKREQEKRALLKKQENIDRLSALIGIPSTTVEIDEDERRDTEEIDVQFQHFQRAYLQVEAGLMFQGISRNPLGNHLSGDPSKQILAPLSDFVATDVVEMCLDTSLMRELQEARIQPFELAGAIPPTETFTYI